MAASDSRIIPIKNQAYRFSFSSYTIVNSVVSPNINGTGMDTEVSKDGGTFVDATNEAIEVAPSSGIYYIDLTSAEMNADTVIVRTTFTNPGALPFPIFLYPQEAGDIQVNVTYWNGAEVAAPDVAGYPKITAKTGTGAGEFDLVNGVLKANLVQILATALTESGVGRIVAGLKKFFDVITPTSDMNTITAVTTATNLTNAPTNGDLTATMKASVTTAATAATPTANALGAQAKTDVQAAMTSQGYTTVRAGYLDTLNGLVQAVWDKATSALTIAGSIGKRLSDNVDVAISTRSTLTDAQVWGYVVEGTHTALGYLRLIKAVLMGKVMGANTTNPKFYDDAGTKARVNATTDGSGNRSSVTLDES